MNSRTFPGTEVRLMDGALILWILLYALLVDVDDILSGLLVPRLISRHPRAFCVEPLVLIPRWMPTIMAEMWSPPLQGSGPASRVHGPSHKPFCVHKVASQSLFAHPAWHAPSFWCSTGTFKSPTGASGRTWLPSASPALSLCSRR